MSAPPPQTERPLYTKYRARPGLLRRGADGLSGLRPGRPRTPLSTGSLSWRRVLRALVLGAFAWVGLSLVLFLVSAQIQQASVSDATERAVDGGAVPPFSPTNVLVLGSDQRTQRTAEPGSSTSGPSRSDSILLVRTGGGASSRLSIARDTVVDIPGAGRQKINAAYAIGGAPLAVETIESYTGVDIHHVVEVSFANFGELIDAMGGITYRGGCVVSRINGGFRNGGYTLRLPAGSTEIDGRQALALARTRTNLCNRDENDLTRARRQQKIFAAMKGKLVSPEAFVRLPLIAWNAPKALKSDMSGPTLLGLFAALASHGTPETRVLGTPDGTVPDEVRRRAVERFLEG